MIACRATAQLVKISHQSGGSDGAVAFRLSARALTALSLFATLGTLTEAAEQLGVTRSALSHRIAELEKRLGVALVRKAGRRISLTEDGERLLASMGDALDRMEAAVEPFRRDRGQIRLSTVATFASHWLIPRISQFQAQHPRIEVAIFTTTRAVDFKKEEMDCAIRHGRGTWRGTFRDAAVPGNPDAGCDARCRRPLAAKPAGKDKAGMMCR